MLTPHTDEISRKFQRTIQKHTGIMPKDQNKEALAILLDPKATYEAVVDSLAKSQPTAAAAATQTQWQQPVGPIKEILPPDFQTNHNIKVDLKNTAALQNEYKVNLISYIFYKVYNEEAAREIQSKRMNFGSNTTRNEQLIDEFNKVMATPCAEAPAMAKVMRAMLAEFDKTAKDPDYVPPVQVEFVEHIEPTQRASSIPLTADGQLDLNNAWD